MAANAHATDGHDATPGFPAFDQIDTFPSQIFWLAVTFGILYFALSRFILPKIAAAIEAREGAIAQDVAEAAAAAARADEAVKAMDARLAEARLKARDTAARARTDMDAMVAAETARVEADLAVKLEAAEARIKANRTEAMKSVGEVAQAAAQAMAEKIGGKKVTATEAKRAVAQVLS